MNNQKLIIPARMTKSARIKKNLFKKKFFLLNFTDGVTVIALADIL
jgi:hypothetical protein